jgi:hypothetical protein
MQRPSLIFILGTAFCGSTLLGQTLSTRPDALFVGELYNVNQGWREVDCACSEGKLCSFWKGIRFDDSIFQQLLARQPGLLIDASKYPNWILQHAKAIRESRVVVLFRDPENFVYGCYKRRKLRDWGGHAGDRWTVDNRLATYVNWYRLALDAPLQDRISFLSYDAFAKQPVVSLRRLHAQLGTQYIDGEERFWQKTDNHILGSNGGVVEQIRRGQIEGAGCIEYRDNGTIVRQQVANWTERAN